ncbi:uncharacterized protein LOC141906324 [Tubulanus polymorphus]|uniref:uncharacterized protein LOC141906324 n=1 Tax=Tubulanus polymorphus TaxID=672921 RepID=UPI003DA606E3
MVWTSFILIVSDKVCVSFIASNSSSFRRLRLTAAESARNESARNLNETNFNGSWFGGQFKEFPDNERTSSNITDSNGDSSGRISNNGSFIRGADQKLEKSSIYRNSGTEIRGKKTVDMENQSRVDTPLNNMDLTRSIENRNVPNTTNHREIVRLGNASEFFNSEFPDQTMNYSNLSTPNFKANDEKLENRTLPNEKYRTLNITTESISSVDQMNRSRRKDLGKSEFIEHLSYDSGNNVSDYKPMVDSETNNSESTNSVRTSKESDELPSIDSTTENSTFFGAKDIEHDGNGRRSEQQSLMSDTNKTERTKENYDIFNVTSNMHVMPIEKPPREEELLDKKRHLSSFLRFGLFGKNDTRKQMKHRISYNITNNIPSYHTHDKEISSLAEGKTIIYIGGLFELSETSFAANGHSELAAAQMAIDHVNLADFLPGYYLKMLFNDTQCDNGVGMDAFYDIIYRRKKQIVMLVGTSCSSVTKYLGEIVPHWNLVQISYAATNPALSSRDKYPTFFRLATADSSHNLARMLFIQRFGWDTVATLTEDAETFTLAISDMSKDFSKANISVKASPTFRPRERRDLKLKMEDLKEADARIIIGSFGEDAARQVFCEAYQQKLYGPRYVWLLLGWYTDSWWRIGNETNCTHEQLTEAVEGHFTVNSLNTLLGNKRGISGIRTQDFYDEYEKNNLPRPLSPYGPQAYDTIWTIALTIKEAMTYTPIKIEDFSYEDIAITEKFMNILSRIDFDGISGPVSFNGPDRRGITVLKQNQGGQMVRIAMCYPDNDTLDFNCSGCQVIQWGREGKIPVDEIIVQLHMKTINDRAFHIIVGVSTAGIAMAISFLSFNIFFRKLKYIKLSSPKLNNVAVIGCILVYKAVILLGFDDRNLYASTFPVFCTARAFLFAAGFSLSFGAMFTKTYRVHQICSRAHSGLVKSKLLKDKQLLIIIGALLLVDTLVICVWCLVDPMHRQILNFTREVSSYDPDVKFVPQMARCHSVHIDKWTGGFYAYKGLLLIFGVYMAWETRHVKIPALNDSQYIGMNVYNVVVTSVIVVALSNILSTEPTVAYNCVSAFIILSTSATLALLFIPKIYTIIKSDGNPVITTSGLMVEANTRRFAVDEKRELYYRAEVQNRVYKRELMELDQELTRLQKLLKRPSSPYTSNMLFSPDIKKNGRSPLTGRHMKGDEKRPFEASDEDDIPTELPEVTSGYFSGRKRKLEKEDSGIYSVSFKSNRSNVISTMESSFSIDEETEVTEIEGLSEEYERRYLHCSTEAHSRDNHSVYRPRRQSRHDGTHPERQSLLRNCDLSPNDDEYSSIFVHKERSNSDLNEIEMQEFNTNTKTFIPGTSMQKSYSDNQGARRIGGWGVTPIVKVTPPQEEIDRRRTIRKSHSNYEQRRIQQEFLKIKRQLKSLSDIKCEVAEV